MKTIYQWKLKLRRGNPGAADWGEIDFGNGRTHSLLWHDAKIMVGQHNRCIQRCAKQDDERKTK
jgi:hypothetical protein